RRDPVRLLYLRRRLRQGIETTSPGGDRFQLVELERPCLRDRATWQPAAQASGPRPDGFNPGLCRAGQPELDRSELVTRRSCRPLRKPARLGSYRPILEDLSDQRPP